MFWKKAKKTEEEEDIIKCKGCGAVIKEENAVVDISTGSFVCKDCKNMGFRSKPAQKDPELLKIEQEEKQMFHDTHANDLQKLTFKCKKCGYNIKYSDTKGLPETCGYCGVALKQIKK